MTAQTKLAQTKQTQSPIPQDIFQYLNIPGPTFLTQPKLKFLHAFFNKLNNHTTIDHQTKPHIFNIFNTKFAFIATNAKISTLSELENYKRKFIIMSHIDHPGLIIEPTKQFGLGSLYLNKVIKNKPPNAILYDQNGNLIAKIKITKYLNPNIEYKITQILNKQLKNVLKTDSDISKEQWQTLKTQYKINALFGLWDTTQKTPNNQAQNINQAFIKNHKLYATALDNDIVTVLALHIAKNLAQQEHASTKTTQKIPTVFVFTKYEEVFQISSYNLAKSNILSITQKDMILNLESMKVNEEIPNPEKYSNLNYENGPIVSCCEKFLNYTDYQYQNQNTNSKNKKTNLLYQLLQKTATRNKLHVQFGCASGSTDAKFFAYFKQTPNIVTLNIPNKHKHNVNEHGEIVPESINLNHYTTAYKLLTDFSQLISNNKITPNINTKNTNIPHNSITNINFLKHKELVALRLTYAFNCYIHEHFCYNCFKCKLFKLFSYIPWALKKLTQKSV